MNTVDSRGLASSRFWHYLFDAGSIAVIGANNSAGSWGFDAMRVALASTRTNPDRKIYAVNPNDNTVQGNPSYAGILDIPGPVELAVVVVRADLVPDVLRQCAQKKTKAAVIISAGFAEVDEAGAKLQAGITDIARQGGFYFVGPNCVGHADFHTRVASAMVVERAKPGPVSLITQSGTLGATIVQIAAERGLGISKFISTGNEASLRFEDYLEYLAQDNNTRIIAGYIEGLREGRRFFELAKEITPHKPIIAIKTGTTAQASKAAKSHTGALAGSDLIYSAAFKQSGVIRAEDEEELCDVAVALLNQPLPKGNGIGILTMGGGFGVVTAEACEKEGLKIADLEPETIEKLNGILPPRWSHGNPVDLVGMKTMGGDATVTKCIQYLMEDKNIDCVVSLLPPLLPPPQWGGNVSPEQVQAVQSENLKNIELWKQQVRLHEKPLFMIRRFFAQAGVEALPGGSQNENSIPEYTHHRRAARVLRHLVWYRQYLSGTWNI